jgi:hypothetical protein
MMEARVPTRSMIIMMKRMMAMKEKKRKNQMVKTQN